MSDIYIVYWLLFANALSFVQMVYDKHLAEAGKRRIAEGSLLGWMTLGGAPAGLLASRLVRHKTRKQPFATNMLVLAIVWAIVLGLWRLDYLDPLVTQGLAILARAF